MPLPPSPTGRSLPDWAWAALVVGIVLAIYGPALHGALLWDDPAHVTRADLRDVSGLARIWTDLGATQQYYPVLHSAFWLEHRLWGNATLGYHLVNVLLHATACVLFALVLRGLWLNPVATGGAPRLAIGRSTPWLAALLLAAHPVAVESVAWISEQKNTLSLVFYLAAALAYLRFAASRHPGAYALATGLFLLALGTKTVTATLPAALLVVTWWRVGRIGWRRDLLPLLPWFAVSLAAGLLTAWVERTLIGATGATFALTLGQRLLLASRIAWFYLGKLVWPAELAFFYPRWDVPASAPGWWPYLAAALVATAALVWLCRVTRGPLAGWLLYGGALVPALGFFNVFPFQFSYVADHFQYLASLALFGSATAGFGLARARLAQLPAWLPPLAVAGLLLLLGSLARAQAGHYRNNETLMRASLALNPDGWMAHHILAVTLSRDPARAAEAIPHYRAALRLQPTSPDAHLGLAVELAKNPATQPEAIALYENALALRPLYVEAHHNLAVLLAAQPARLTEAIRHYETALALRPDFPEAHANLATALLKLPARHAEAEAHYATALRLRPSYPEVEHAMANLLSTQPARRAEALTRYAAALRGQPDSAPLHFDFACALAADPTRWADAVAHLETALRLAPQFLDAHNILGILHAQRGDLAAARLQWETAARLDPAYAPARQNLRRLEQLR